MKKGISIVLFLSLLTACSEDEGLPDRVPNGGVTGKAVDSVLIEGKVSAYTLVGKLVGESVTDENGEFILDLQAVASQPLKLVAREGRYVEEVTGINVSLGDDDKLVSMINYKHGESIAAQLTYLTTLAAGFTEYLIDNGLDEAEAVNRGNNSISNLYGFDIQETEPVDIMNPASANAIVTDSLRYSFITAALSETTRKISVANNVDDHELYTSIKFISAAYEDIKVDGLLDGRDKDGALFMGVYPLSVDTYRHENALNILVVANNSDANKTSITPPQLFDTANQINNSNHPVFISSSIIGLNNELPVIETISLENDDVIFGDDFTINLSAVDATGINQVQVQIDNGDPIIVENYNGSKISLDTTLYSEGEHAVRIIVEGNTGAKVVNESTIVIANELAIISGIAFDNLLTEASVKILTLSGQQIGEGETDEFGRFSISIDRGTPSQPLRLVVTGGQYTEESSGVRVDQPDNTHISALVNYTSGENLESTVSYLTTLAAGYAEFQISGDVEESLAIGQATSAISSVFGVNVQDIEPVDITNAINANIALNDALKYSLITAALSETTFQVGSLNTVGVHTLYNSSVFIESAYQDIKFDGLLNGIDGQGAMTLGIYALSADVYRHTHALNMLNIANNTRNKTQLSSADILASAVSINNSNHPIFGEAIISPIQADKPVISAINIADNTVIYDSVSLSIDVSSFTNIASLTLSVDGGAPIDINIETANVEIDTTTYEDGEHTLTISATSYSGGITTETVSVRMANTPVVVDGTAFDNLLRGATIEVFTFDDEKVGEAVTDDDGYYTLSLELGLPSQPLKIMASFGEYDEEFSKKTVELVDGEFLFGLINYQAGQNITTSITYLTTLATAYAEFLMSTGVLPMDAIDQANSAISNIFAVDVVEVQPKDILDLRNASPFVTNPLKYAFTTAAVSVTAFDISDSNHAEIHDIYNSITFAKKAYEDLKYDGVLNGVDVNGIVTMGTVQVDTSFYRNKHALNMLIMANHENNLTGLDAADLFDAAKAINDSEHHIFGSDLVIDLENTKPSLSNPSWVDSQVFAGVITLGMTTFDIIGVDSVTLEIDGTTYNATNMQVPVFSIDTSEFVDGVYDVTVTAINTIAGETSFTLPITIANTGTAISNMTPAEGQFIRGDFNFSAKVSDPISVESINFVINEHLVYAQENLESPIQKIKTVTDFHIDGPYSFVVKATNGVGYEIEQEVEFMVDNTSPEFIWSLRSGTFFSTNYDFDVTMTDNLGIASATLLIDGVVLKDFGATGGETLIKGLQTVGILSYLEGEHTLTLNVRDNAGNSKIESRVISFDRSNPSISISTVSGQNILEAFDLNYTVADSLGFNDGAVVITIGGIDQPVVNSDIETYTIDPTGFEEGPNVISITATDKSDKTASSSLVINFGHLPNAIGSGSLRNERDCVLRFNGGGFTTIKCSYDLYIPLQNIRSEDIQTIDGLPIYWGVETINGVVNIVRRGVVDCFRSSECSGSYVRTITLIDIYGVSTTKQIFSDYHLLQ